MKVNRTKQTCDLCFTGRVFSALYQQFHILLLFIHDQQYNWR
jgi:hypothetical protein